MSSREEPQAVTLLQRSGRQLDRPNRIVANEIVVYPGGGPLSTGTYSDIVVRPVPRKMWTGPIMQSIVMLDSFDKRRREYKRLGWVYAARNPCFADAVFKVGQTKVSPVKRVEHLSGSASVFRRFELVYFVHVSDRDQAEAHVHQVLASSRINPAKEFFEAPLMTVVAP